MLAALFYLQNISHAKTQQCIEGFPLRGLRLKLLQFGDSWVHVLPVCYNPTSINIPATQLL